MSRLYIQCSDRTTHTKSPSIRSSFTADRSVRTSGKTMTLFFNISIKIAPLYLSFKYLQCAYMCRPQIEPSQLCASPSAGDESSPPASLTHFAGLESVGALGLELFAGSDRVSVSPSSAAPDDSRRAAGGAASASKAQVRGGGGSSGELAEPALVAFDNFLVTDSKLIADRFALDTTQQRRAAAAESHADQNFRVPLELYSRSPDECTVLVLVSIVF